MCVLYVCGISGKPGGNKSSGHTLVVHSMSFHMVGVVCWCVCMCVCVCGQEVQVSAHRSKVMINMWGVFEWWSSHSRILPLTRRCGHHWPAVVAPARPPSSCRAAMMVSSSRRGASAVSDDDDESHSEAWCPDWAHSSDEPSDNEPQHKNPDIEPDCVTEAEGEYSSSGAGTHGRGVPVMPVNPTGQVVVIGGMLPQHKDVVIKLPWNSIIVGHSFHLAQWLTCEDERGDFLKSMPAKRWHVMRPMVAARLSLCTRMVCLAWQPWKWRAVAGQPPPAAGQSFYMVMVEFTKPMAGISSLKIALLTGPRGLAGPDRTHGIQDGGVWLPAAIPDGSTIAERA